MTNVTIQSMLFNRYNAVAYTHNYILAFPFKGVVYAVKAVDTDIPLVTTLDHASGNGGYSLRFKPNMQQRQYLLSKGATALCSTAFLEELFATSKYNRGDLVEKMIAERNGIKWSKNDDDWTSAPDVTIDGIDYQVKFYKATIINERTLMLKKA